MKSALFKILGLVGSTATLAVGSYLFAFLFVGTTLGSMDNTLRAPLGWLNMIGTPFLSLAAMTYILKKTWGRKFALWSAGIVLLGLVVVFLIYRIWPRFI